MIILYGQKRREQKKKEREREKKKRERIIYRVFLKYIRPYGPIRRASASRSIGFHDQRFEPRPEHKKQL